VPSTSFRLRTVPRRIQALTAVVLLTLTALFTVTGAAMWDARGALRSIGHVEGPMVVATNGLYLALSDMDSQVANALLTGGEADWLCDPAQEDGRPCTGKLPRYYYDIRREDAQRSALQAARLAENDPVRLRTVQSVLDGLHQYDQRVQAAMERAGEARHTFGSLPPDAALEYRAATALMTEDLLPKANNLTLGGAATVDATYRDERSRVLSGRVRVLVLGLAMIAVLAGLQIYIAVRFRRVISLFLVAAVLGTAALTVAAASLLATEADYLRAAKEGGFDPVLRLSRTQAIGRSLDADRTRYLLDPSDSDRYDQTYFEKSQAMLYLPDATDLESYYTKLGERIERHGGRSRVVAFGGFYGTEAREAALRGQRDSLDTLLAQYGAYQQQDRRVRGLAEKDTRQRAAIAHMDPDHRYLSHPTFREHDAALDARVGRHQFVVDHTVLKGERALRPWKWLLPGPVLAIAALVLAGVWPRLKEYR
jgi:hypothetical protein